MIFATIFVETYPDKNLKKKEETIRAIEPYS